MQAGLGVTLPCGRGTRVDSRNTAEAAYCGLTLVQPGMVASAQPCRVGQPLQSEQHPLDLLQRLQPLRQVLFGLTAARLF
jgi:hypothetical protein